MVYFPDKRELDKDQTEFPLNTFFYDAFQLSVVKQQPKKPQ